MDAYQTGGVDRSSIEALDDKALMLRFQTTGDAALMTLLFERHKDALKLFLMRLSGNESTAEDISQRTWVKLLEVAERSGYAADQKASFKTYLYTMARNAYLDEYRRSENRATRVDAAAAEELEDTASLELPDMLSQEERRAALNSALGELPQEQREVLAFWAADISYQDIAKITGASRDTVIGRKRYGIARLRTAIGLADTAEQAS